MKLRVKAYIVYDFRLVLYNSILSLTSLIFVGALRKTSVDTSRIKLPDRYFLAAKAAQQVVMSVRQLVS